MIETKNNNFFIDRMHFNRVEVNLLRIMSERNQTHSNPVQLINNFHPVCSSHG